MNKIGRNDPCPCGSGKKYKKCCGDESKKRTFNATVLPSSKIQMPTSITSGKSLLGRVSSAVNSLTKIAEAHTKTPPPSTPEENHQDNK